MTAAYDQYDYKAYWSGRDYEHESEVIAIKSFLSKIPSVRNAIDIGCGFGRLAPYYKRRTKKITLVDPSTNNLRQAKSDLGTKNFKYLKGSIETVTKKIKSKFDLVVFVRVMHHVQDPEVTIKELGKITRKNGYIILEFANKLHYKALLKNICKGNFTFPLEIFPEDKRSKKSVKKNMILFQNYHPDIIKSLLGENSFKIVEMRSVSNIRSEFLKKHIPIAILSKIEKYLQIPFSKFNFGPSIFILAKKTS